MVKVSLKDISIFSSGQSFLGEQEILCTFGIGLYDEHFCEIVLNFSQLLRIFLLKIFLFLALVAIFFS